MVNLNRPAENTVSVSYKASFAELDLDFVHATVILVCSVPPSGMLRTGSSCFVRYPWGGRYRAINGKAVVSMQNLGMQ